MPAVAPLVSTKAVPEVDTRTKLLPPYNVIIENDDDHSMEFVIETLITVLGCKVERAAQLMLEAHTAGRAIVWTGPKEVAELKHDQITTRHEIRERDGRNLGPLGCYIEAAPGA